MFGISNRKLEKALLVLIVSLIGAYTSTNITAVPATRSSATNATSSVSATEWYPVQKIVDGDTIDVSIGGKIVRVRLIGLNTPESVDPRRPVECFGKEASAQMKKIIGGQSVRLETDPSQSLYDKYDRLLAYVYAPLNSKQEGLLVNQYIIAEGYGYEYTYDLPYKYQKEFKAAESSARQSQKGLWAPGVCQK